MKRLYFTLLCALGMGVGSLTAQNSTHKEVSLTKAGTLLIQLTQAEVDELTSIKITGLINESDIALLNKMSTDGKLVKIDLSEASFGETNDPLLLDATQYFLPMIAALNTADIAGVETYESKLGHKKDSKSLPGFWTFFTQKELFFMTGYMNGWEGTINEVVLKSKNAAWVRSPQVRSWIHSMGYVYQDARTDGDLIFKNEITDLWCLLHFTPYNTNDYPGVHFSTEKYDVW